MNATTVTLTDRDPQNGDTAYRRAYQFDAAARLTQATLSVNGVPDHVLGYSFADLTCPGFRGVFRFDHAAAAALL
ncbi:hypothetical protein [Microcella sp.]|uniref:hypothetical protein n=1 Tax=Microcella sp. TaxID=1913979 RepID=UPI003F719D7D